MNKQGFFALASVTTAAVMAISFAPVPRPFDSLVTSAARTTGRVVGTSSLEIRQAPVPLLMKSRPPREEQAIDADAPVLVSAVSARAARVDDSAAKAVDARGSSSRLATSQPTAAGTRWAP
jgi:hypothetical protein